MTKFSVVMPAHNEEAVIIRTLGAFMPDLNAGEAEVIVVPNGCTDRTAELAKSVDGVETIDVDVASKSAALNAGDQRAHTFPRIYVDADVVLSAQTLRALAHILDVPEARVASPTARFVLQDRPWAVRSFYDVYQKLPYIDNALIGGGAYGLSEAGRARFGAFPTVTADDLFVQRLFAESERITLASHFVEVQTPKTMRDLIAIRTRTAFGNRELANLAEETHGSSTAGTIFALVDLIRRSPRMIGPAAVYVTVVLISRLKSRRRAAASWQRDHSTR